MSIDQELNQAISAAKSVISTFGPQERATCKAQAAAFAKRWYERPASGCDEATLASLLEEEITSARLRGKTEEAAAVISNFARACGVSVTITGYP